MQPVFVLVHSPSVGPLTWAPVAAELEARGSESIVPSLLDVADAYPSFANRVVSDVTAAMNRLDGGRPVVLVAHSNAGLFVPLIAANATRSVRGCLFVDAALPALTDATRVASSELLHFLRPLANNGLLPPWTGWFDEDVVTAMLPDPHVRAAIVAEQPQLPLSYYEQAVPVPAGWDAVPCSYLLFGPPYDQQAAEARQRGWSVEVTPGLHLHQVVDPAGVAERTLAMGRKLAARRR